MDKELTVKEIQEKYRDIEDKIPSIWPDWETAGKELAQDIVYHWNIQEGELIRVIALVEMCVRGLRISQHIDPMFSFAGLYPFKMKQFDITPDGSVTTTPVIDSMLEELSKKRKENTSLKDVMEQELNKLQKELNKLKENLNL